MDCYDVFSAPHVFVHGLASMPTSRALAKMLSGLDVYAERALLAAGPADIVCVASPVDASYLQYLSSCGVGPSGDGIVVPAELDAPDANLAHRLAADTGALSRIRDLVGAEDRLILNPFIASAAEFELAAALEDALGAEVIVLGGPPATIEHATQKHLARRKAQELGVPTAPGEVVRLEPKADGTPRDVAPLRAAVPRWLPVTGRVIVRGSRGASGTATHIVDGRAECMARSMDAIAASRDNTVYLVEAMLPVAVTPNVQVCIEPGSGAIRHVSATDQRLDRDLRYDGNIWPSSAEHLGDMVSDAVQMAGWLRDEGFTGLLGLDFVEHGPTGEREYILAELNPRTNAVTYPKALAERLERGGQRFPAFLSGEARTDAGTFNELATTLGDLLWRPGMPNGVFPYNCGCLSEGEASIVALGQSRQSVEALHGETKLRLQG